MFAVVLHIFSIFIKKIFDNVMKHSSLLQPFVLSTSNFCSYYYKMIGMNCVVNIFS
jgi:hypothetical protein